MTVAKSEFTGNIGGIRAVEDTIRASKQYTESLGTMSRNHPIQDGGSGSRAFRKDYQVYPGTVIDWEEMSELGKAIDYLFSDAPCIELTFFYDYRRNIAKVIANGGPPDVKKLSAKIPGFSACLAKAITGGANARQEKDAVEPADRVGDSPVSHPQSVAHQTSNGR